MRTQNRLTYLFNNFQVAASFSVCGAWRFFQIFLISPNLENLFRDEEAYLVLNKHVTSRLSSRAVNGTLRNFTVPEKEKRPSHSPFFFNPSLRHYAKLLNGHLNTISRLGIGTLVRKDQSIKAIGQLQNRSVQTISILTMFKRLFSIVSS